jgi:hypothetical protein
MTRVDRPALRGTLLGRLLRLWNPVYKVLLRSPLHWPWSRFAVVLEFSGIKSGRTYATPTHYVPDGQRLLITSGDRWCRNLVGGAPVGVWLRGRRLEATAEVVGDEAESLALHRLMIEKRPFFRGLMGIRPPSQDEQLLRSIRAGRRAVIVRLPLPEMEAGR